MIFAHIDPVLRSGIKGHPFHLLRTLENLEKKNYYYYFFFFGGGGGGGGQGVQLNPPSKLMIFMTIYCYALEKLGTEMYVLNDNTRTFYPIQHILRIS